ncbi:MAG: GntR family transcriptional regulator [Frankiales bacterium]|nr:GntR family transcriptional regulator [Frankiales bacterium]
MQQTVSTVLPSAIYEELRERILSQSDAPGTSLTESAVALHFGVARPTAKMAIERLVGEGLLRRESHKAAHVPELSRDDIIDLFNNRAIIEGAALSWLASSGAAPREALDAHRALQATTTSDAPFAVHDIAFHRALVMAQPSRRLVRMHSLLMGEIELCIGQVQAHHLLSGSEIAAEHQGILDAVAAADADAAEKRTREHILHSRDRLVAFFDETHPDHTPAERKSRT